MVLTVDQVVRHKITIFGDTKNEQPAYEFNSKVTGEFIGVAVKYTISSRVHYKVVYGGQLKFVSTLAAAREWLVAEYNERMAAQELYTELDDLEARTVAAKADQEEDAELSLSVRPHECPVEKEQACPKVELVSYDDLCKIRYEAVLNGHRQHLGTYFKATKAFISSELGIERAKTCEMESQVTLERIIKFANRVSEGML